MPLPSARHLAPIAAWFIAILVAGCAVATPSSSGQVASSAAPTTSAAPATVPAGQPSAPATAPAASAAAGGGAAASPHLTAIAACSILDEATASSLVGFPVKYFGPGDPEARVPFQDVVGPNSAGVPIRQSTCGYWEPTTAYDSRTLSVGIIQGDPAKPGTWSVDTAHAHYAIVLGLAASSNPQTIAGIGDEAFAKIDPGATRLVTRSGDVIVTVEVDWGAAKAVSLDTIENIAKAVIAKL